MLKVKGREGMKDIKELKRCVEKDSAESELNVEKSEMKKQEKTYSRDEVNKIVNAEKNKALEKYKEKYGLNQNKNGYEHAKRKNSKNGSNIMIKFKCEVKGLEKFEKDLNMEIKALSEILGHSNVSITLNVYVHTSLEQKKREIEKLVTPDIIVD